MCVCTRALTVARFCFRRCFGYNGLWRWIAPSTQVFISLSFSFTSFVFCCFHWHFLFHSLITLAHTHAIHHLPVCSEISVLAHDILVTTALTVIHSPTKNGIESERHTHSAHAMSQSEKQNQTGNRTFCCCCIETQLDRRETRFRWSMHRSVCVVSVFNVCPAIIVQYPIYSIYISVI